MHSYLIPATLNHVSNLIANGEIERTLGQRGNWHKYTTSCFQSGFFKLTTCAGFFGNAIFLTIPSNKMKVRVPRAWRNHWTIQSILFVPESRYNGLRNTEIKGVILYSLLSLWLVILHNNSKHAANPLKSLHITKSFRHVHLTIILFTYYESADFYDY